MNAKKIFKNLFHPIESLRKAKLIMLDKHSIRYDDEKYLKKQFKLIKGYNMDFSNPKTFSEKLQWLKLNYHNPLCATLSDKILAKEYLASIIGDCYFAKTLGVWDKYDDIDFSLLPKQFVIKTNHDCGGLVICKNKDTFNNVEAKTKIDKHLADNYYLHNREWSYKNIKPKVFVEEFISNPDGSPLVDYKFYCFNGKPIYFMYSVGEAEHNVRNHKFDMQCNSVDHHFKKSPTLPIEEVKLPGNIDEMIKIVTKVCQNFPHVRVDLYNIDGKIYVGEMTFYTNGGYVNIIDKEYDLYLGSLIPLIKYED